ncbi:DUF7139 domain-containing protein [Halorubrum lacusprofundi]|jgi:hypothetical protein|uniref:Uncharacterized protein n=1 Tax=Halorubrum lacusprofundi (strain ATCC 49239 / DSM 5036 / JCM 8891 / ACAM 34) TaxID=416348 RepID=B9LS74_HALLT|nr:hypothetical protein [Halorubrum lacusprofundi]ACM55919.1 conserved hypothetical protein [Halorubrum lacusprofundi ATCC 49239]MCG1006788.1 hypothetical protein [Halorubrum lacusprofundi]
MTSLSEAYGGRGRSEVDPRRVYLGVGSFVAGTLLLVVGLFVAAEVVLPSGYSSGEARRLGGVLGGVGVPLVFLGVMTVLPADRNTRVAAIVGAAVMCLGVALFAYAYPNQWVGGPHPELRDLTLPTAGLYFVGAATTLWSVFVGVANFKTRNDPGGTVTMEVTHKGETKVVEVDRAQLNRGGGVGLLGGTPDGDVETQTNRQEGSGSGSGSGSASKSRSPGSAQPAGMSDGGATATGIRSPLDEDGGVDVETGGSDDQTGPAEPNGPVTPGVSPAARDGPGDTYCGNCAQFDYARTEQGMQPYCDHHDELMDDMDACEEWTPR